MSIIAYLFFFLAVLVTGMWLGYAICLKLGEQHRLPGMLLGPLNPSPRRVECQECGAMISAGVEPVRHCTCDACLADVIETNWQHNDNGPAPSTRPQLPPPPPKAFKTNRDTLIP